MRKEYLLDGGTRASSQSGHDSWPQASEIAQGNRLADKAKKEAAQASIANILVALPPPSSQPSLNILLKTNIVRCNAQEFTEESDGC